MAEGLKIVIGADVSDASAALKGFAKDAHNAADSVSGDMNSAFKQLQRQGVVSLGSVRDALSQFKEAMHVATDPGDIEKLNKAISFLQKQEAKLKSSGLEHHLEGVTRSTNKASSASLALSRVFGVLPPEVQHLTHSVHSLVEAYEQIRHKSASTGQAFKSLGGALLGPLGIGVGLSIVTGLLTSFGVELFHSKEKVDKTIEKIKELVKATSSIKIEAAAGTAGEVSKVQALAAVVLDQTAAYQQRNRALNELKDINKNYFGDLTLEAGSLAKLTGLVNEYTSALIQQAVIKEFSEEIGKVSVAIAKQIPLIGQAGAELKKFERRQKAFESSTPSFGGLAAQANTDQLNKVAGATDRANKKFKEEVTTLDQLTSQSRDLRKALNEAVLESLKFKPLDDKGGAKVKADDIIAQAKRLAAFLDRNTQFEVIFEVDETKSEEVNKQAARDFIAKAKSFVDKQTPEFNFKPLLRTEFKFIQDGKFLQLIRDQAGIEATKTFKELKREFEDNIKRLAENNPIIVETNAKIKAAIKREDLQRSQLASGLGLRIPGINETESALTDIQKQSIVAANTVSSVLTPAFQGLFSAIKAGENPLQAFFQGIGQAVEQLIQKLIAAAVQALILSAIFPTGVGGVKGFGGFFKNILGFASGGLVTGPTLSLIGEGRGTNSNNPEVVAPLDRLRGMLAGLGNNEAQVVVINGRVRGNDFQLMANRTNKSNRRLGTRG